MLRKLIKHIPKDEENQIHKSERFATRTTSASTGVTDPTRMHRDAFGRWEEIKANDADTDWYLDPRDGHLKKLPQVQYSNDIRPHVPKIIKYRFAAFRFKNPNPESQYTKPQKRVTFLYPISCIILLLMVRRRPFIDQHTCIMRVSLLTPSSCLFPRPLSKSKQRMGDATTPYCTAIGVLQT